MGIYVTDAQYTDRSLDDSGLNAAAAKKYGWNTAHLVEPTAKSPPEPVAHHQISNLEELRKVFPEVFKSS
jgi:pyrimidine and pyridine-specific 5'-nucleotidase